MSTLTKNKAIHFSGLTELRGIAAVTVMIAHIDQFGHLFDIPKYGIFATGIASQAVTMFFVLSGFLITYLLIKEKEDHRQIFIRKFYWRRILRIWPAYYATIILAIFFGFLGITQLPSLSKSLQISSMFVLFMPNLAYVISYVFGGTSPLWSIGVEEQFYAIWPWVVKKMKNLLTIMLWIIATYLVIKITIYIIHPTGGAYALIKLTRFDCMAIGGLGALTLEKEWSFSKILFHPILLIVSILTILLPFFTKFFFFASLENEIFAVACLVIIMNISSNSRSFLKLRSNLLKKLGEISYGIYVYHLLAIYLVAHLGITHQNTFLSYLLIIIITLLIATLSYQYLEKPFLKMKKRFVVVNSKS